MNEAMKAAWLEINQMMGVSSYNPEELDVFLRTWQRAIQAEREECAKVAATTVCDTHIPTGTKIYGTVAAAAIRARGQA
jgi:hypothetical protein